VDEAPGELPVPLGPAGAVSLAVGPQGQTVTVLMTVLVTLEAGAEEEPTGLTEAVAEGEGVVGVLGPVTIEVLAAEVVEGAEVPEAAEVVLHDVEAGAGPVVALPEIVVAETQDEVQVVQLSDSVLHLDSPRTAAQRLRGRLQWPWPSTFWLHSASPRIERQMLRGTVIREELLV